MTQITHSAVVPYTIEQLFKLVNDVPAYQEFIPYCKKSEVCAVSDKSLEGTLFLEYFLPRVALFGERWQKNELFFTTRNQWQASDRIHIELVANRSSSDIAALSGGWIFEKMADDQVKVTVDLQVALSNRALNVALYAASAFVSKLLIDAFLKRAKALYDLQPVLSPT